MPEPRLEAPKRPRGAYSRVICLECQQRRIRCELPDGTEIPDPGELRTLQTPCYRCKRLDISCVVRQTALGRAGLDCSLKCARGATDHSQTHHEPISRGILLPDPASIDLKRPAKIQILPLRQASAPTNSAVSRRSTSSDTSDNQSCTAKRVRASKPKVRSGCLTCKIRRVKCDETKPSCLKCTSTGRKCDGYVDPPPRKRKYDSPSNQVSRLPEPTRGLALSPLKVSSSETRGLEYFCVKTAPYMGMYFDSEFWTGLLVQASVSEPALTHVMVAVGVFAERRELLDNQTPIVVRTRPASDEDLAALSAPRRRQSTDQNDTVALINYNKSIDLLTRCSSSENTELVLLAAILFVCVEFLRGDDDAALQHFKGGMAIIMHTISLKDNSPSSRSVVSRIKSTIMPFFSRMEMLYILFGNEPFWPYTVTLRESIPVAFDSIAQARESMVHLMNLSLRFVRKMEFFKYDPSTIPASAFGEQAALLDQLHRWRSPFSAYQADNASATTPAEAYASNVLEIHRLVAQIWVNVSTTPFECAHDAHIPSFTAAVSLAEQLSAIANTQAQKARYSSTFLLDMEIVGPIHWVSIKCREPTVRRRAIAVQRSTNRREGIWDSRMTAVVAESVMAAEEVGLQSGELPCEEARVHHSFWMREPSVGPSKNIITHRSKPHGVFGDWMVWRELISMEER